MEKKKPMKNEDIVTGIQEGRLEIKGAATEYIRTLETENKRLRRLLDEIHCKYFTAITLLTGQRNWLGEEIAKERNENQETEH